MKYRGFNTAKCHRLAWGLATVLAGGILSLPVSAESAADFYKGKSIYVNIGFSAGGFDTYARVTTRHMRKHIPGQPTIIARNMPGAGSVKAAMFMYTQAPQDGTHLATIGQSAPVQQALGDKNISFDNTKFYWIGNPNKGVNTIAVWHETGIESIEDVKTREVVVGATGINASMQYPQILNSLVGTKFRVIIGYPGGAELDLAMERGEIDGRGSNAWASWKSSHADWVREKKINILVQMGLSRDPELADVPLMTDLATSEEDRQAMELLSAGTVIGRPLFTTPNVPLDRVAVLRAAFDQTMKDPEFLAEADKMKLDLDPLGGDELQKVIEKVVATPKPIVEKLIAAIEGKDIVKDVKNEARFKK